MNNCQLCNKIIPMGEKFATLDYNIETMKQDIDGLSVEVISSETIYKLCIYCAAENNQHETRQFLKRIISQSNGRSN